MAEAARELRAGPLRLLLEEGGLRYLRLGGREVLRRVYAAVRDRAWNTVPAVLSGLEIDADERSFRAAFDARCRQGGIDFAWRGLITGDPQGTVRFSLDGIARSTFLRNRIGLCVLHPLRECAGRPCAVEHADGSIERGRFPEDISPHPPFRAVRAISHEVFPGIEAEVRFEGDVFEMEDQRNWTDASFKTYSTPVEIPFPVEVKEGTRIAQAVVLTLRGVAAAPEYDPGTPALTAGGARGEPLPRLGLGRSGASRPPETARLRALGLSHLRADLHPSGDFAPGLGEAAEEARALGASLELALHLTDDAPRQLERLGRAIADLKAPVSIVLVFKPEWVPAAREALRGAAPSARIGAGTNTYFAELNRNRPPAESVDFLFYSLNPQVHASDDATLVENLQAQGETVRCARRFSGRPVAVTPVTLKPRFNPCVPADPPPPPDGRQTALFGAAWTVGSLKALAEAGAFSVTCYETRGPRGVLDGDRVFPLYHVIADVAEFSGGEALPSGSSHPLLLAGLTLRKEGRMRFLAANLTGEPRRAAIEALPGRVRLRRLNGTNVEGASARAEAFRAGEEPPLETRGGRLDLALLPFEVVRIDGP